MADEKRFEEDENGALDDRDKFPEEWTLITEGSSLLSIMNVEGVDFRRCKTNHITKSRYSESRLRAVHCCEGFAT